MGDRANVYVKDGGSGVFLYTHWAGSELPETVQSALRRGVDRWNDGPYLTRIVFAEMVSGNENGTTGYGISAVCGDGDDRIIVLDSDTQRISFAKSPEAAQGAGPLLSEMAFAEYVALEDQPEWPR